MAKITKLDPEEGQLLGSFERGEWKQVKDVAKVKRKYATAAAATLRKDRRVNLRISSRDLQDLRARAVEEGLPYQTLMGSVLHKYARGRLREI